MILDNPEFTKLYEVTLDQGDLSSPDKNLDLDDEFLAVINELGGKTFNNGIYRVYNGGKIASVKADMERSFPEYQGRIIPFSYDWLGRHFAIDLKRREGNKPQILLLEIGTGQALEIPSSIINFHTFDLIKFPNDALAAQFFQSWRNQNPASILPDQCVGYKIPLFLGGKDELSNLELSDLSVYLEVDTQIKNKLRAQGRLR